MPYLPYGMVVHFAAYPNTPCGVPACRAAIINSNVEKVTCKRCLAALKEAANVPDEAA